MTDLLMQSGSKGSSNERTCQTLKVGKFYLDSINHLIDMAREVRGWVSQDTLILGHFHLDTPVSQSLL